MVKQFLSLFSSLMAHLMLVLGLGLVTQSASANAADDTPASGENQTPTEAAPDANESPSNPAPLAGSHPLSVNPLTGLVSVSAGHYKPLTRKERWNLYWQQNYLSAGSYFGPVFTALLLDQTTGTPEQWGGGMEGYGRRLASRLGQAIVQGTVQAQSVPIVRVSQFLGSVHHRKARDAGFHLMSIWRLDRAGAKA